MFSFVEAVKFLVLGTRDERTSLELAFKILNRSEGNLGSFFD